MPNYSYFANSAALTIQSGATAVGVGVLRNVKMTPKFEYAPLFGMESLQRQGIAKYNHTVEINCKFAMWDATNDYILSSLMSGITGDKTNPATLWNDAAHRNTVATFIMMATFYDSTRARTVMATAYDVYFESVPFEFTENEWISRDLTGTATGMIVSVT